MRKNVVIISNYYPPEIGAAANRIKNLAEGLKDKGNEVSVISPMPNYPKGKIFDSYKRRLKVVEDINNIRVRRFWIYATNSKSSLLRFLSMLSFAVTLWFSLIAFLKRKPDLIIIQSPPLLIAFSGLLLAKIIRSKTLLNVSDLWPLSAVELGVLKKGTLHTVLCKIEKLNYRLADSIMGQSNEIKNHIEANVNKEVFVYRNLPIYKKYETKNLNNTAIKIVYAGLLGYAQGIFEICKGIDFKKIGIEFHIYGDGMEASQILNYSVLDNNIFFHGSVTANEVKEKIREYDFALIALKNRIYGAVPSKIFELSQLGIPMIYTCSNGEAAKIIRENKLGFISDFNNVSLSELFLGLKQLSQEDYMKLSINCLNAHKEVYHLNTQLDIVINHINE